MSKKKRPSAHVIRAGALIEQELGEESPCTAAAVAEDNLLADGKHYETLCQKKGYKDLSGCRLLELELKAAKARARRRVRKKKGGRRV